MILDFVMNSPAVKPGLVLKLMGHASEIMLPYFRIPGTISNTARDDGSSGEKLGYGGTRSEVTYSSRKTRCRKDQAQGGERLVNDSGTKGWRTHRLLGRHKGTV